MSDNLLRYMDKVLEYEERGFVDEAVYLCDKLLGCFSEETEYLLVEKAKLEFRNHRYKDALFDFIQAYSIKMDVNLYNLILDAYLEPNLDALQKKYQENLSLLDNYPFYYHEFNEDALDLYVLWQDEEIVWLVNTSKKTFGCLERKVDYEQKQEEASVMIVDCLWNDDLLRVEQMTRTQSAFMDMENPYYLVYDYNFWKLVLQVCDLEVLTTSKRVVFLIGVNKLLEYFQDDMAIMPHHTIFCEGQKEYGIWIGFLEETKKREYSQNINNIKLYYADHENEIIRNIKSGYPRILFYTSRFTTALQYHSRDCAQAAQRLGCESELLLESDGLHRITKLTMSKHVWDFKPDIVFCIDHFRFDKKEIPKEVVYITWIQDYLEWIMNDETPKKLVKTDFILNHFVTAGVLEQHGYPIDRIMPAMICANSELYKPYSLTDDEKIEYGADICMICHASDVEQFSRDILKMFSNTKDIAAMVENFFYDYKILIKEGTFFYLERDFQEFFRQYASEFYQINLCSKFIEEFTKAVFIPFTERAYRQALADWLIEAGYTNIKLWGKGWLMEERYQPYAMGTAPNGEVMSKILQSSKIVLGNNFFGTGAARAWETMLSGAFYMSNYVPPQVDRVDIRSVLKEEHELVMFYDQNDLITKIDYFLHHEEERKRMADIGRTCALERATFDSLMKRTITFLQDYFLGLKTK